MKAIVTLSIICLFGLNTIDWETIDFGMYVAEYHSTVKSSHGNSIITILKINPNKFKLKIYSTNKFPTAEEWAKENDLLAVINAGMYQYSGMNLGYMKQGDSIYNPKFNNDNTVFCFNPKEKSLPKAQIVDREFQDWRTLVNQYESCTQSIRMVDLNGNNIWSKQDKKWSMVVVAMDKDGNVLFIHSRSPYEVRQFIDILLESPLNIKNMMYLEGGPEASMYINHNGYIARKIGSYETNFYESDDNDYFWVYQM